MTYKETKSFFVEKNYLNKGTTIEQKHLKDQYNQIDWLPSNDILAAYEDISPGSTRKILDLIAAEQQNSYNSMKISKLLQAVTNILGKVIGVILVFTIGITTTNFVTSGYVLVGLLYAFFGFFSIFGISLFKYFRVKK